MILSRLHLDRPSKGPVKPAFSQADAQLSNLFLTVQEVGRPEDARSHSATVGGRPLRSASARSASRISLSDHARSLMSTPNLEGVPARANVLATEANRRETLLMGSHWQ